MSKAKEISALWSEIRPQIGKMINLCHQIESHSEDTSEAYRRGYEDAKHECEDCTKNVDLNAIRKEAYEQGCKDGKIEGQAETWVCVKKIALHPEEGGIALGAIRKIFGCNHFQIVFRDYSASEAIEKIRQYEQKQEEIRVGDEVVVNGLRGVVMKLDEKGNVDRYFTSDGKTFGNITGFQNNEVTKTGRHFPEIAEVLAKMKEK